MNDEEAARELSKLMMEPLMIAMEEFIKHRAYLVILEILKNVKRNERTPSA